MMRVTSDGFDWCRDDQTQFLSGQSPGRLGEGDAEPMAVNGRDRHGYPIPPGESAVGDIVNERDRPRRGATIGGLAATAWIATGGDGWVASTFQEWDDAEGRQPTVGHHILRPRESQSMGSFGSATSKANLAETSEVLAAGAVSIT